MVHLTTITEALNAALRGRKVRIGWMPADVTLNLAEATICDVLVDENGTIHLQATIPGRFSPWAPIKDWVIAD